jgi:hypothetical protein
MEKFWKVVNEIFDWFMNLLFAAILLGGGIYVIKDLFF